MTGYSSASFLNGVTYPAAGHFICRTDSTGRLRWLRRFSLGSLLGQHRLMGLPDGGALLACETTFSSTSAPVVLVARFDSAGAVLWQRQMGRPYSRKCNLVALADGSYALAGYQARPVAFSNLLYNDGWVLRFQLNGDTIRSRYFGADVDSDGFNDVQPAADGGLLLSGSSFSIRQRTGQGWVLALDSLDRPRWQLRTQPDPTTRHQDFPFNVRPLLGGGALVIGSRFDSAQFYAGRYLAAYRSVSAGGVALDWRLSEPASAPGVFEYPDLNPAGELTFAYGFSQSSATPGIGLLRYTNAGTPYVPNYCQRPPAAYFAAALAAPNQLQVLAASTPGPRYGVLLLWHWDFGDGTTYDGPAPPPHRYATVPAPGTAVRLTVTNNLGCTATHTEYPWGGPTATQQSRDLAARAALWPNPATGRATLRLPDAPAGPASVMLLDVLGRSVRRYLARPVGRTLTQEIDLAGLAPGVYAVRVALPDGRTFARRLLVQE